jgi:plastocyanin
MTMTMHDWCSGLRRRELLRVVVTVVAVVGSVTLCGTPAAAEDAVVTIDNFSFSPAVLTVKPGTTVTFENRDDIPHTVVDAAGHFRSKALDTNDRFSFTAGAAGATLDYFCGLHPHMKGRIVVAP